MDKKDQQNFLLKSGMGTVAAEDYDEAKHGPVVDETKEQYEMRVFGRFNPNRAPDPRLPGPPPTTTIAGLRTFEAADLEPDAPPVPAAIFTTQDKIAKASKKVATEEAADQAAKAKASHDTGKTGKS